MKINIDIWQHMTIEKQASENVWKCIKMLNMMNDDDLTIAMFSDSVAEKN